MKWHRQIAVVYSKALRILGLLKHSLYQALQKVKLITYKTICRPLLEYAAEIWDPVIKKYSIQLESIQNKAIRFINNLRGREVSVTDGKIEAGLTSLQKRRQMQRISLFCRVTIDTCLLPSFENTIQSIKCSSHIMNTRSPDYNSITCETNLFLHSLLIQTARKFKPGRY